MFEVIFYSNQTTPFVFLPNSKMLSKKAMIIIGLVLACIVCSCCSAIAGLIVWFFLTSDSDPSPSEVERNLACFSDKIEKLIDLAGSNSNKPFKDLDLSFLGKPCSLDDFVSKPECSSGIQKCLDDSECKKNLLNSIKNTKQFFENIQNDPKDYQDPNSDTKFNVLKMLTELNTDVDKTNKVYITMHGTCSP